MMIRYEYIRCNLKTCVKLRTGFDKEPIKGLAAKILRPPMFVSNLSDIDQTPVDTIQVVMSEGVVMAVAQHRNLSAKKQHADVIL